VYHRVLWLLRRGHCSYQLRFSSGFGSSSNFWTSALLQTVQSGGVVYLAHIGGMSFGAVTARLFEDQRRLARQPVDFDQTYDA
jgi:membrane associated rhomboid family serine protease